jgi:hypothetical protein
MVLSSVEGVLGVFGVRKALLRGSRLPYGERSDGLVYPAVLIWRNPIAAKRFSALDPEDKRGSADSASDIAEELSLSDILGDAKGGELEGTICRTS